MSLLPNSNILYVDNDAESCAVIRASFRRFASEFNVTVMTGEKAAFQRMREQNFDMLILEYCLTEMTAPEMCRQIRQTMPEKPVIIYSALFHEVDRTTAMDAGANAFVVKSDGFSNLASAIRRLLMTPVPMSRPIHIPRRSSSIL